MQHVSRTQPIGWRVTASSGRRASLAWNAICASCKERTRRMNKSTSSLTTPPAERTLTTTRVFDAPRELVYRAWTDPRQLALWFPPEHFTAAVCQLDGRPGGALRIDTKGEDSAGDFAGAVFTAVGV